MADLLTQTEYANRRGCKKPHINRLVKAGIIRLVNGRIDPEQADRAIADSQDPSRAEFRRGKGRPATQESQPSENSVTAAKINQIRVATALKNLVLKEKIGTLAIATGVETKGFEAAQQVKDGLFNISDRLSPLLAAEPDEIKIRNMLNVEFMEICEGLADAIK